MRDETDDFRGHGSWGETPDRREGSAARKSGREILASDRGVVLVLVLGILAVLMVVALSFSLASRTDGFATAAFKEAVENRFLADAGVQRAIVELYRRRSGVAPRAGFGEDAAPRVDGAPCTYPLGQGFYTIRIADDSGKININAMDDSSAAVLHNLLMSRGMGREEADTIVDSILDWKDGDDLHRLHGAENEYYLSLATPYRAKNRPFDTPEELLLVKGITRDLLFGYDGQPGIIEYLTVHGSNSKINVNSASAKVLMAIPHMPPHLVTRIMELRNAVRLNGPEDLASMAGENMKLIAPYIGYGESGLYTIEAIGHRGKEKRGFRIRATVVVDGVDHVRYVYYKSPVFVNQ